MENQILVFVLVSITRYVNEKGKVSFMLKLHCPKFIRFIRKLGDIEELVPGSMTYNVFFNNLPEGYVEGEQDGSKKISIEHFYEGDGVWNPVGYNVKRSPYKFIDKKTGKLEEIVVSKLRPA